MEETRYATNLGYRNLTSRSPEIAFRLEDRARKLILAVHQRSGLSGMHLKLVLCCQSRYYGL
jgi:hypothetical protein